MVIELNRGSKVTKVPLTPCNFECLRNFSLECLRSDRMEMDEISLRKKERMEAEKIRMR